MTPQSAFMVVAPVRPGMASELRSVLRRMTRLPGMADPDNALIPFGKQERLHFARFVILDDATSADRRVAGAPASDWPVTLAFLGDCDGTANDQLADFVALAEPGLRAVFVHCEGCEETGDLLAWMIARSVVPSVHYVNRLGRTVRQIREEAALHRALRARLARCDTAAPALAARQGLLEYVAAERRAGRLLLSDPEPTPSGWRRRRMLDAVLVPMMLILSLPLFLLLAAPFLYALRYHERNDAEIDIRPTDRHEAMLCATEDHDVTNQFSSFGSCKPGAFRLAVILFVLRILRYFAEHLYTRGRLARVLTIHSACWILLGKNQRVFFGSNYDGSLNGYTDDFINKVGWGLNILFSNGLGYPATRFLIFGGSKNERPFKHYIRRHQIVSDVWYRAYPGLTCLDLARNSRVRDGLLAKITDEVSARRWIAAI